jgi:hypothetical protein
MRKSTLMLYPLVQFVERLLMMLPNDPGVRHLPIHFSKGEQKEELPSI